MAKAKPDPMVARDYVGYGEVLPDPEWPGDAFVAVNFNLNIEAGAERSLENGDGESEDILNDVGAPKQPNRREPLSESAFEYGSRRGVWRLLDAFRDYAVPTSILAVAQAAEKYPELIRTCVARGHEIVSHGYRWIDYGAVSEEIERDHIRRATQSLTEIAGTRPLGWMTGRPGVNTRRLLVEQGGYLYDRDSIADELPYWLQTKKEPHLVIPYSFETNDNRCNLNMGFSTADDFFIYMKDAFDTLYAEGKKGSPKLLSIGVHDRILGRPSRAAGLIRFLDYMREFDRVWYCRGIDIAQHWRSKFPPDA